MRSRRTAVDDGTWLYHVIFEQDPANPDPRPVDYIVISSGGDGDDDFGSAAGVAPDYMTLWGSGIISFGQVTKAQIVFMGLANPNLDTSLFPGVFSDLGYLDPATVETINVEIKYELVTAFPTVLTRVVYTSDGFSELASYQNRLGSETINASGNVRPALNFQIFGEETDDVLVGSAAAQTIYGFGGHDTLTTGAARTDLFGGEGDDTLTDRFGQANVYGEAGADVIQAGPGDFIDGGADNDTILAVTQSAADLVANGFTGIRGYFDGGTGTDKTVFDLSAATAAITLTLEDQFDSPAGDYVTLGETLALVRMEETEIRGGAGADVITGAGLADTILGGAGADVLSGGGGRDTLDGGTGGLGAGQFDRLEGGADDDTYIVRTGTEQLVEEPGGGTDTVRTDIAFVLADQFENLTLTGTGAIGGTGNGLANTLLGNTGANTLDGRGGHDVLNGGNGADTMSGGSGDDLFIVDNTADKVVELFGEGADTVQSAVSFALAGTFVETLRLTGSGNINATGNAQGNVLFGNSGANVLTGLGGNDAISGGAGADTMIGGTGDDSYSVDNIADKVTELDGEGSDAVRSTVTFSLAGGFAEILRLLGSAAIDGTGNDLANTLYGNTGANVLTGLGGNDVIDGDQGADTMAGGFGDDLFIVDNAADKVIELSGQGTDTIQSFVSYGLGGTFVESLRLMGTAAINAVGNSQANALYGNGAANVLDGQGGADRMLGGAGDDTYVVDNAADRVVERSGEGTDRILAGVSFTLAETYVETLQLTGAGAIDAAGNSQANTLLGNGAANTLTGLGGSDVLDGGGGADRMVGGTGDDVYQVDNTLDVVVEAAGEGTDTVFASATFSLVGSDVEVLRLAGLAAINATGNDLANTLVGNDAANILTGLGGHDMLDGGKGADTMIGGDGDDTFFVDNSADRTTEVSGGGTDIVYSSASFNLAGVSVETLALTGSAAINGTGNSAANTLIGNAGANTLSGLGSADTLDGGMGADKLIGGTGGDVFRFSAFASDADADTITDFVSGTDQIALVSAAFNEMRLGPLAASAFVAGTAALDAADRLIYEAASGKLWFDSDGTGEDAAVLIALLAPGTALVAADIVIV